MNTGPIDLDDLQAIAELSLTSWAPLSVGEWYTRDGLLNGSYSFDVPDSDFIEAASPETVLMLIAELREARAAIERVQALAWDPDGADMYGPTAIVVDATVLQKALEGRDS